MEEQKEKKVNQIDPKVLEMLTEEEKESLEEFSEMGIDVNQFASDYAKENNIVEESTEDDESFDDVEELEEEDDASETPETSTTENSGEAQSAPKQDFSDMFSNF